MTSRTSVAGALLVWRTLGVILGHTSCRAGPTREVEATAFRYDLQVVLVQRARPEPSQGVPNGLTHQLDCIACEKDMNLMPRLNCRRRDKKASVASGFSGPQVM